MSFVPIDSLLEIDGQTHDQSTGALVAADSTPTFAVFQQGNAVAILTGNMTVRSTGVYIMTGTASAANGFTSGKMHQVKMTAVIAGVTDITVLSRFFCTPAWSVAGVPKVDVADWMGSAPSVLQTGRVDAYVGILSAAAIQSVWDALSTALTTAGSIGKRVVDFLTGDSYARLGAPAGASHAADIAAVRVDTQAVTTTAQAELSAPPASNAPPLTKVNWLFMLAKNKLTQTSTQQQLLANDNTTVVGTSAVSDDLTTAVRGKFS